MSKFISKRGCLVRRAALLFFAFISIPLSFVSCSTVPPVSSFILADGRQQFFVRPVDVKGKDLSSSIDFTVHIKDDKVCDAVVVNYTLNGNPLKETKAEKVSVSFVTSSAEYKVNEAKVLFKNMKPLSTRFTSTLMAQDFTSLVRTDEMIYVKFTSEKGSEISIPCPKLRKTFSDFKSILDFE